jgi:signal transduction histidine kinase
VWVLIPVAVALIAAAAVATLAAWRSGADVLEDQRRREAERVAAAVAGRLGSSTPSELTLLSLAPQALSIAVLETGGTVVAATESPTGVMLPEADERSIVVEGRVVGWSPTGAGRLVRVELADLGLTGQRSTQRIVGSLLLVVVLAGSVLVLLFLRRYLQPWEALLAQANLATDSDQGEWIARAVDTALARHRGELDPDTGRAVAASFETGVLVLSGDRQVTAVNPAALELLGIGEPRPGSPLGEALATQPEVAAMVAARCDSTDPAEIFDVDLGAGATLGISVHRLTRGDGGALVLLSDRTRARREQVEGRLATALAELGELSAGVAHELRNGLAALSGRLALLDRRRDFSHLEAARTELHTLERVVADFLAFARPGTAQREIVDLGALLRRLAPPGAVVEVAEPSPLLEGDPVLLERALANLIDNATRAHGDAAEPLELAAMVTGERIVAEIRDRGPGIPADLRPRLFQPFASARPGGVGLGLAVARRIVDLHGGTVELQDRESSGTIARVTLRTGRIVTLGDN